MLQIVALLDRPSPKSFGKVAFVVRDSQGVLRTRGLAPNHLLREEDLRELVEDTHALLVPQNVQIPEASEDLVAGWLGDRFADYVRGVPHGPPLPSLPPEAHHVSQGSFWVARPQEVQDVLVEWIRRAARCAIGSREMTGADRAYLAGLMSWVLPSADETKAARLCVQVTAEARAQEVEFLLRMERDAGRPPTRPELEARLARVAEHYRTVGQDSPATNSSPTTTTT